jgi:hypothetical protein
MSNNNNEVKEPFDLPVDKKEKKPRRKIKKERLHIYLTEETINLIDDKSDEIGYSRSVTIQLLLNYAIKNFNKIPNIINGLK